MCNENIGLIQTTALSLTCSSFSDLDYNLITIITTYIHSKYKPLQYYEPDDSYKIDQYNAENDTICILLSLNHHYRSYKAKNFYFRLNQKYSLKYYGDEDLFSLKMNIDDTYKQLRLDLSFCEIEDVSVLGHCHTLILNGNTDIKDVSRLGN